MKSLCICELNSNMKRVYGPEVLEALRTEAGLEDHLYTKAQILSDPEEFHDVEYLFSTWGMPSFTEEQIRTVFPSLKALFYAAGSVQSFAHPFLRCGVQVFSAWAANAVPVAEYTVSQIILANKGFFQAVPRMSSGDVAGAREAFSHYRGNFDGKIGLVGAGMIGKLVIQKLAAYRMQVLVFDPFLPDSLAEELHVTKCSLERLFSECSVVSNHLANNPETVGMLHYGLFSRMPPYATFLNTGRGAQVVEDDLVRVLTEREDLTAILDVTWPEPPAEGHAFYRLPNCLLTPHMAGSSGDEVRRMSEYMLDEYRHLVKGLKCRYSVTEEMLRTMA